MIKALYPYLLAFAGIGMLLSAVVDHKRLAALNPARRRWISIAALVAFLCQTPLVIQKLIAGAGWNGWLAAFGILAGMVGSILMGRIGKSSSREKPMKSKVWLLVLGIVVLLLGDGILFWACGQKMFLPVVTGGGVALAIFAVSMALFRGGWSQV